MHYDFGIGRRFVRSIDPGKLTDLPCPRLLVQIFGVAFLANVQRSIHENLDKLGVTFESNRARALTIQTVR